VSPIFCLGIKFFGIIQLLKESVHGGQFIPEKQNVPAGNAYEVGAHVPSHELMKLGNNRINHPLYPFTTIADMALALCFYILFGPANNKMLLVYLLP
jgi:hypothetical protein